MTKQGLARIMEATWPAAHVANIGPWRIREGQGGGKRVSAATAEHDWTATDISLAETAMTDLGQERLFLIRDGEDRLDQTLADRGYRVVDPVLVYAGSTAELGAHPPDPMAVFSHWPPLAICREIWALGGIGPARLAVMERVAGPKTILLARSADRPAGAAFVATAGQTAMLHALEVVPDARRQGSARNMIRAAAAWALTEGADTLSVLVTTANSAARSLYAGLGMDVVGQYHYRQK